MNDVIAMMMYVIFWEFPKEAHHFLVSPLYNIFLEARTVIKCGFTRKKKCASLETPDFLEEGCVTRRYLHKIPFSHFFISSVTLLSYLSKFMDYRVNLLVERYI